MKNELGRLTIKVSDKNGVLIEQEFSSFPITFGRSPQCHLSFSNNTFLSRVHGSINVENGTIAISDLNSTNGISYNGEKKLKIFLKVLGGQFTAGGLIFNITPVVSDTVTMIPTAQQMDENATIIASEDSVLKSEEVKKNSHQVGQDYKKQDLDIGQLTVISSRLIKVADQLKLEVESDLTKLKAEDIALQGIITWGHDILDVRQFQRNDELIVGINQYEPIFLPSLVERMKFGVFKNDKGHLLIPKNIKWRLHHGDYDFTPQQAVENQLIFENSKNYKFELNFKDVCTIDLGSDISLHLRYVEIPRPLVKRTLIENREEFTKAITVSALLHLVFALISALSTPKVEAPKLDNVPTRFAKLLVEPPKNILTISTPTPTPEPIPTPVPTPLSVAKEMATPTPLPKPQVKKQITKQTKKSDLIKKDETVERNIVKQAANISQQIEKPKVAEPQIPQKSQEQLAEESFMAAFNDAPKNTSVNTKNIKIENQNRNLSPVGVKTGGLVGAIKSKVSESQSSVVSSTTSKIGEVGFAQNSGGQAGKKSIGAAVLGSPKFENPSAPQGLSNDEVMKVVNRYLSEIHRCYERALFQDNNLVGRVEYEWTIDVSGIVSSVQVKRSEISKGEYLNNCVMAVFKKMKFPNSKNGQTTTANIGFPFGKN